MTREQPFLIVGFDNSIVATDSFEKKFSDNASDEFIIRGVDGIKENFSVARIMHEWKDWPNPRPALRRMGFEEGDFFLTRADTSSVSSTDYRTIASEGADRKLLTLKQTQQLSQETRDSLRENNNIHKSLVMYLKENNAYVEQLTESKYHVVQSKLSTGPFDSSEIRFGMERPDEVSEWDVSELLFEVFRLRENIEMSMSNEGGRYEQLVMVLTELEERDFVLTTEFNHLIWQAKWMGYL